MPRHPITDTVALDTLTHLGDMTRTLNPDDMRIIHRIDPGAPIRIDEIHARRLDVDEHLTRPRPRRLDLRELQHLGSTSLHCSNRLGHHASCI